MNLVRSSHSKYVLFIILLVCSSVSLHAQQNPQALFDQANDLLQKGNFEKAMVAYHQIENQNKRSGALFLNMGIAYQRLDSLGKAKFYFLKAGKYEETASRAKKGINYLENHFSRQSAVLPKLPWDRATAWLQDHIGADTLLIFAIILLNVGMLIFILQWFIRWKPTLMNWAGIIIMGLAVLLMASGFYTAYVSERYHEGVMISQKAPVTQQPREGSLLISHAFEGYDFTVDKYRSSNQKGWSYVRMSNGQYGWIATKNIMVL